MASSTNSGHGAHANHGSTSRYWFVWLALLGLTALTYFTAKQHWPSIALPLALFIATVKAGLVVAIFMQLKDTGGPPLVSFTVSIFMVLALILGVMGDIAFRYPLARPDNVKSIQLPPLGYNYPDASSEKAIGNPVGIAPSPAVAPVHPKAK